MAATTPEGDLMDKETKEAIEALRQEVEHLRQRQDKQAIHLGHHDQSLIVLTEGMAKALKGGA